MEKNIWTNIERGKKEDQVLKNYVREEEEDQWTMNKDVSINVVSSVDANIYKIDSKKVCCLLNESVM
jgi:hypothetical protein